MLKTSFDLFYLFQIIKFLINNNIICYVICYVNIIYQVNINSS